MKSTEGTCKVPPKPPSNSGWELKPEDLRRTNKTGERNLEGKPSDRGEPSQEPAQINHLFARGPKLGKDVEQKTEGTSPFKLYLPKTAHRKTQETRGGRKILITTRNLKK